VETPLSAATTLQELYLQSWGDKIRIFPALPADWKEASFINFRAKGNFLVSATRENGSTALIQIESFSGGSCRVQTGMNVDKMQCSSRFKLLDRQTGLLEIETKRGELTIIKQ
jgi:hypothetical protein